MYRYEKGPPPHYPYLGLETTECHLLPETKPLCCLELNKVNYCDIRYTLIWKWKILCRSVITKLLTLASRKAGDLVLLSSFRRRPISASITSSFPSELTICRREL